MRGYFAIGVYHPKTTENIGTLWRSAFLFGASYIFTIGRRYHKQASDTPITPRNIPLHHYENIEDFLLHTPVEAQIVCIEQNKRSRPLNESNHPQQAIYLLGAEDYGLPEKLMEGRQIIHIPYTKDISMNVAVAGSIVMYDRYIKSL